MRREYAHQTSHALVVNEENALYVFEDLRIRNMTHRPKAKTDARGRFLANEAQAKAGLHRAILSSAWGQVVEFTRYKALRANKLGIMVPPQYSSQECAACGHKNPANRLSQAECVCQDCEHTENADHNAAVVLAKRGINKLLSGDPLTKTHKSMRILRELGPERSEVTPGETNIRHAQAKARTHTLQNQELLKVTKEPPASAS